VALVREQSLINQQRGCLNKTWKGVPKLSKRFNKCCQGIRRISCRGRFNRCCRGLRRISCMWYCQDFSEMELRQLLYKTHNSRTEYQKRCCCLEHPSRYFHFAQSFEQYSELLFLVPINSRWYWLSFLLENGEKWGRHRYSQDENRGIFSHVFPDLKEDELIIKYHFFES
jgi:hypothetical protein